MADAIAGDAPGFVNSPFADAVLTPSFAVASTGPAGDKAAPLEGTAPPFTERARPVIEIGRRVPLLAGRSTELDELSDRLRRGESMEIFASDGAGKTSLVNMLLHDRPDLKGYFADGVVLLSSRLVAPGDLVGGLFRAFFVASQASVVDEAEMLRRLSPLRALIVLDDIDSGEQEFQEIVATLSNPVFLVTSGQRRLHDFASTLVGPLDPGDLVEIAELRLGRSLDESDRQRVVDLSRLLDDRPRSWARALQLIDEVSDLTTLATRLETARDPHAETARLAIDAAGVEALKVVTLLSELKGTAVGEGLLEEVLEIEDVGTVAGDLQERGVGLVLDGKLSIDDDVAAAVSESMDGDQVTAGAFDKLVAWSENAEPAAVCDEVTAVAAFAEWGADHDKSEAVVDLGRRVDEPLFRTGRWATAAFLLGLVSRAGAASGRTADKAWALHQMGVRELALGDTGAAKSHLREARSIRRRLGDKIGEELSRHHLKLLGPLAAIGIPLVGAWLLAGAVVTGGVAAVAVGGLSFGSGGGTTTTEVRGPTLESPGLTVKLEGAVSVRVEVAGERLDGSGSVQVLRRAPNGLEVSVPVPSGQQFVVDRGLEPKTTYVYQARTIGNGEPSPWSAEQTITTTEPDDTVAPDAPTGVVGELADGVVTLAWTASRAGDVRGYDVFRDGTVLIQNVAEPMHTDDAPTTGVTHRYQVLAIDEAGNASEPSAAAEVEIPGTPPTEVDPPTGLAGAYESGVGVTLTWVGSTDSFRVDRRGGTDWTGPFDVPSPLLFDEYVADDEIVTYTVWAIEDRRLSDPRTIEIVAVSTDPPRPPQPSQPTISELATVLRIEWSPVSIAPHPVTYRVLRDRAVIGDGLGGTTFDDPLPSDGTYSYTIVAVNHQGVASPPSPAFEVTIGDTGTLNPQPRSIDFGRVTIGDSPVRTLTVANGTSSPIDFGTAASTESTFAIESTTCGTAVPAGSSCTIRIRFTPSVSGDDSADITASDFGVLASVYGRGSVPDPIRARLWANTKDPYSVRFSFRTNVCVNATATLASTGASLGPFGCRTDHVFDFDSLDPSTAYTAQVRMTSADGDTTTVPYRFTTAPDSYVAIEVSGSATEELTSNSVLLRFRTNSCTIADWVLDGGSPAASGSCFGDHSRIYDGLTPSTDYTVTVDLEDPDSGETSTTTFQFTTLPAGPTQQLQIDYNGDGSGLIHLTPGGTCTNSCTVELPTGADVLIEAVADIGSTFAGWLSADCTPSGDTCLATMTGSRSASPIFELLPTTTTTAATTTSTASSTSGGSSSSTSSTSASTTSTTVSSTSSSSASTTTTSSTTTS